MARRFQTLDVFTETALAGNPLAVVLDAEGLDDPRMQAIAGEFNLSETVFVFEPRNPINTARVRIFTPKRELPFAGHPTVGTAALIAHRRASDLLAAQDLRIVLEEAVGDVVCSARHRQGQALAAYFELPKLPERLDIKPPSRTEIAAGLGLEPADIGFGAHEPSLFSAGAPFLFVPVRSLGAVGRAAPGAMAWATKDGPATYLYTAREGSDYHARMFAPAWGVWEDPATGSAAAAFAGVVHAFDRPSDGEHTLTIEQGFEMGRPSLIALGLTIEAGALSAATIGGSVVILSSGSLDL
ncbi:MAG TPA: PhzF family phenazine biosynthesis protein [Roseiarcus sp.]